MQLIPLSKSCAPFRKIDTKIVIFPMGLNDLYFPINLNCKKSAQNFKSSLTSYALLGLHLISLQNNCNL